MLAAHLGEPIRNFGVGGYSLYQAFLRMKREESQVPARFLVVNIYDDDHYRSLVGWQRAKYGSGILGPPLPYVTANRTRKDFREHRNPCPESKDLYDLCNLDWTYERFKDDFCLRIMLAKTNVEKGAPSDSYRDIEDLAAEHGMRTRIATPRKLLEIANELYTDSAIYSSERIVEKTVEFASDHGKKVLFIASYGAASVANRIRPGHGIKVPETRKPGSEFNQDFANFMKKSPPYVDLMDEHMRDFSRRRVSLSGYLKEYYVTPITPYTHYSPLGNHFTAFAAKDKLVYMLDPKPISYRPVVSSDSRVDCVNLV